jgi:hypothetical protein
MNPEQQAMVVGKIVGAIVVGILCGLGPLIYGIRKGKVGLAIGGLLTCIVAGFILGIILAAPTAGLFCYLIAQGSKQTKPKRAKDPFAPRTPAPEPYEL